MILKWLFDRLASLCGLLIIWPIIIVVAIMVKVKMPGGPAFFCQKRVGKDGKLFTCHKFRTMLVAPKVEKGKEGKEGWSSVSVAGDSRITPFGAKLRHYKIDELPELWDVLVGNMSFVGPRPDVPGYADKLVGDDRDVLKLRPGITGPATLKYRLEDEMIAAYVAERQAAGDPRDAQAIAVEYNDTVIYPDKVRLNKYYYEHYSLTCGRACSCSAIGKQACHCSRVLAAFWKDLEMIFATVLGRKVKFGGEEI